jgi:HK97 family phage portal protein
MRTATPEELASFIRGWSGGYSSTAGVTISETSAMRVAAAWRCIQIISSVISSLPFDLVERVGENERRPAVGHPMREVMTIRPNPWQTPQEFKKMLQMHLLLRGNAYARKVKLGRSISALIPVRPDRVQVEQEVDGRLIYRVTRPDGRELILRSSELLHIRGMTLDGVTGLSPLSYMREALGLSIQGERAASKIFVNGSLAAGILKHPRKLSQEVYNRLKESWRSSDGSLEDAGATRILEEGMEYEKVAMSASDAQFLQMRDFQRYDIAMFFGVPPHMIGATEKQTSWGSGIEQQNIGFVQYTVNDWFVAWQESLKRDTLDPKEQEKYDFRFFPGGLLKGDTRTQWDSFVKGLQWGVFSPDDVRAMLDLNPRPDGKGGEYFDPPNTAGGTTDDSEDPSRDPGSQETEQDRGSD